MCSFHVICTVAFECPSSVYNVRPLVGRLRPLKFLYVCSAAPIVCAQFVVAEDVFLAFFVSIYQKIIALKTLLLLYTTELVIIIFVIIIIQNVHYFFWGARKVILSKTC